MNSRADREAQGAQRIAFVHHKGGTGKTTACLNIAGWLAKMRWKVLVIDLDPQGNATAGLGIDRHTRNGTIYEVLLGGRSMRDAICETDSGVYVVPSSVDLLAAETHMAGRPDRTRILAKSLEVIEDYFDYVLIDVPPGSTMLMINGMVAAEHLVIPLDAGVFAYETLDTLKTLLLDLARELGVEVNVMMVLVRDYSANVFDWGLTGQIRGMVRRFLAASGMPDVTIRTIPFSRMVYRAQMKGRPISHYAPFSDAGQAYKRIAKAIVNNISTG